MNGNGSIVINSEEVNSALTLLSSSLTNLEGSVLPKLPGNFNVLSELGLYSDGITQIIKGLNNVISSHKSLISQLSKHIDEYAQKEDQLANIFGNGASFYDGSSNSNSGSSTPSNTIEVDEVEQGKVIDAQALMESIPLMTESEKNKMLELLNINKDAATSIQDLLLDENKAILLYTVLQKIYNCKEVSKENIEDYKKLQKVIIDEICKSEIAMPELKNDSILSAREYLVKISKENMLSVSDILFDSSNIDVLQFALLRLYDGNNITKYDLKQSEIDDFKSYINKVALANNMSGGELLTNHFDLIIRGGNDGTKSGL